MKTQNKIKPACFPQAFRGTGGFLYGSFEVSVLSAAAQATDAAGCGPALLHAGVQHGAAQAQCTNFLPGSVFHAMRLLSGLRRFVFCLPA